MNYAAIVRQTPQNQLKGCGEGRTNLGTVGELPEFPPLIWLAVAECLGIMWVTGVESTCHRQLNGVFRRHAETQLSEQMCDKKLWMENRTGLKQRRLKRTREERTARCSHSCSYFTLPPRNNIVYFISAFAVHLCVSACWSTGFSPVSPRNITRNIQKGSSGNCEKIGENFVAFTAEGVFEFRCTFCSRTVTGWTNFYGLVG